MDGEGTLQVVCVCRVDEVEEPQVVYVWKKGGRNHQLWPNHQFNFILINSGES